jgi:hypothetical protein
MTGRACRQPLDGGEGQGLDIKRHSRIELDVMGRQSPLTKETIMAIKKKGGREAMITINLNMENTLSPELFLRGE